MYIFEELVFFYCFYIFQDITSPEKSLYKIPLGKFYKLSVFPLLKEIKESLHFLRVGGGIIQEVIQMEA